MGSVWRIFAVACVAFSAPPVLAEWDDIRFRLGADPNIPDERGNTVLQLALDSIATIL